MSQEFKNQILSGDKSPEVIFSLVKWLRPSGRFNLNTASYKMDSLLMDLERDEAYRQAFSKYIKQLFHHRKFKVTLTETGIIGGESFYGELMKRFSYKVLPFQPSEDTLDYLFTNGLFTAWDHLWVQKIEEHQWNRLFDLLEIQLFPNWTNKSFSFTHLLFCIQVLSQQASAAGTGSELFRMVPEYQNLESPFLSLQKELDVAVEYLLSRNGHFEEKDAECLGQVYVFIEQCRELIQRARKNKSKYGISFSTTMRILRLEQQLERLYFLVDFVESKMVGNHRAMEINFVQRLINYHAGKNRILAYINQTTHLVAYQATQHTGATGEKYITTNREEYRKMFRSAAGGGFVIGFLCLFKLFLAGVDTSLFGHAFWYSMNYALGFILIYFLHYTVATKQPAMTAATLAKALENTGKGEQAYESFASLFARLFRSQFIAFCGNVFLSFPVALSIGVIADIWMGGNLVSPEKTEKLLKEIDFTRSSALFHAGIAGFHLFFSGLLSGYLVNRSIHRNVAYRFRKHPLLVPILNEERRKKIAFFYEKHLGGISSNLVLGILLGTTGTVGYILGLDWDIRHITFAAGNFALGIVGRGFELTLSEVIISILCIGLIGFFNFIVSFTLSLMVAMRSRKISLLQLSRIGKAIMQRFVYAPVDFFVPPPELKDKK